MKKIVFAVVLVVLVASFELVAQKPIFQVVVSARGQDDLAYKYMGHLTGLTDSSLVISYYKNGEFIMPHTLNADQIEKIVIIPEREKFKFTKDHNLHFYKPSLEKYLVGSSYNPYLKNTHWLGIYPELLGNTFLFSLNVEYMLLFRDHAGGFYARGGIGPLIFGGSVQLIESGFLMGNYGRYFDAGIGYLNLNDNIDYGYTLRLGYRYQDSKGFLFRLAPMIIQTYNTENNATNYLWLGISLGYSFQLKKPSNNSISL